MPYFISEENLITDSEVKITGDEVRHILLAHRSKKGEVVKLQGPDGKRFNSEITEINRNELVFKILNQLETPPEPEKEITLFQSYVSEKALDFIFQKGTELGLSHIVLFNSQSTATKLTLAQFLHKKDRWERILIESAKQCERVKIPTLEFISNLDEILSELKDFQQVLLADVSGSKLEANTYKLKTIALLVGPEGGFTEEEVETLKKQKNIKPINLGPLILRAETAVLKLTSILNNN